MPEAEQGMNMARIAALRAGLPDIVPGVTINRFCSSGLQSIAMAADRIRAGGAQMIVAGGTESMSMIPMSGQQVRAESVDRGSHPEIYMGMGLTAEQVGAQVQRQPRGRGRVRVSEPSEGAAGAGRRQVRRRDCAARGGADRPRREGKP